MRSSLVRILSILIVLIIAAMLPASATMEAPVDSQAGCGYNVPWWEITPPSPPKPRTKVVYKQKETLLESIDAEGYCYTAIKKVNVRSQPTIHATKVATISSAGTEFNVSTRVKNSAGEIWYGVLLANGTLGYIRSDLVNTDHVILLQDPYYYEEEETTKSVPASESASDIINIVKSEPTPEPTPQIIYIEKETEQPTPAPIIVYMTPAPEPEKDASVEPTPQIIYVYKDKENG